MALKVSEILSARMQETTSAAERKNQPDFSFTLNRIGEDGLTERLGSLIEDIRLQGKKLTDHMDIRDMKKYRSLITDFINEVVTNSHKFSRENFLDRRGRHRVYGIVKLVNKELDELAQQLLSAEKDHIQILDKTDQICGLLLDIIV